jgi:hypothetical protein
MADRKSIKRDRVLFALLVFVALGIAISLAFAYFGWAPVEAMAP